jgi:ABC-type transport system substrate-binding protein
LKTIRNWTLALIVIVLIVGVVGAAVYLTRRTVTPSFSLAPSSLIAVQGANITFNVYGLEPNGIATIYFGDGQEANTTSTLTHTYQDSGRYLVGAEESVNGQAVASTFTSLQTIQVTPQVNVSLAPMISIPAISFDVAKNPSAPVVQVGDQVYLHGSFLQPPSGTNVTIAQYRWDFANGAAESVDANKTSLNPVENPATVSYAQPGLYPVTLSLITENSTSLASFKTSVEQTVAVGSSSQTYALLLYGGVVPAPTVINEAENADPPSSLDPGLDWGNGGEIEGNIFSTLLIYNGSSTTNFIPMAAAEVPSIANGEISSDYSSYTFHIRSGLRFSNGDPLTAYDVYYSIVRCLLLRGSLGAEGFGDADWIVAQYLIPGGAAFSSIVANSTDTAGYNSIINSMEYSNASDTITFKLIRPVVPQLLFTALADAQGASILDSKWLQVVGAGITFSPAGFYAYQNEGNAGNFNLEVQNDPVGSGPYMIQSYTPGQSISLVPNPLFLGVPGNPGIPKANDTIVIQWIKDAGTAYDLFRSGQADFVTWLPPQYFQQINEQVANGQAEVYQIPILDEALLYFSGWEGPNLSYTGLYNETGFYNETELQSYFGSQYHMPVTYFANLDVRKAWAYAFDYSYFLDEILGNKRYGVEVGSSYAGVGNIQGLPYSVPEGEVQNVPVYNLTYAKQLLQESGEYNAAVTIPFAIDPYVLLGMDNQTKFAMVEMYAAALHSIDPNIVITPVSINPATIPPVLFDNMPIGVGSWAADYPYPSDFVDFFYGPSLPEPAWLNSTGHPDQAAMYAQMNALITEADATTNATLAAQDYKQIEQIAVNLYLYIYLYQPSYLWVLKPYMNGYQGQMSIFMGPMASPYDWLVKTCGSTQACSGRSIGP